MLMMGKYLWVREGGVLAILLALTLTAACSRRVALNSTETSGQNDARDLPFHGNTDVSVAEAGARPGVPDSRDTSKAIPFKSSTPTVIPAGTLLTVRLENTLTISKPDTGKTFKAVLEEPLAIDGRIVIPRDARVQGRVESARVSIPGRRIGYVRLALDSIRIGDKDIAIPTSSLFARGIISTASDAAADQAPASPVAPGPATIRLRKGRSLTFRLTSAVDIGRHSDDRAQSGTR